jgi:hypothetical protein
MKEDVSRVLGILKVKSLFFFFLLETVEIETKFNIFLD